MTETKMTAAPKIVVIAGPTASGKTALGIALAQRLGGEIVSADSMQVYRGMDIGTAKATPEERAAAAHHMIDVASPSEDFSVARYVGQAAACCDEIISRGKMPILVGGTGLYIDSLISGRDFAAENGDDGVRERFGAEYDAIGGEAMLEKLRAVDPERAAKLSPGDRRRIVRALEVFELTGETMTEHDERTKAIPPRYDAARIVLNYKDRADLYARIDRRVDEMVSCGLFAEVEALLASGIPADCTAMQAIGYKEAALAVRGELSRGDAAALIKQASRRYAKRQLTWFGRWEGALRIEWEKTPDFNLALRISTDFLRSRDIS